MLYILFSILALAQGASLLKAENGTQVVDGRYIVTLKGDTAEHLDMHLLSMNHGVKKLLGAEEHVMDHFEVHHEYRDLAPHFLGYSVQLSDIALEALMTSDEVHVVEEVIMVQASQSCITQRNVAQWGLPRITTNRATSSTDFTYHSHGGRGIDVYVLDTGIRVTHNEFGGRAYWLSGSDFTSDRDAADINGHGTHVAGTVGGALYGVAKQVNLYSVKVLGGRDGWGQSDWVIGGINWAAARTSAARKTSIANLSLGSGYSWTQNQAVDAASAAGLLMVTASGNDNRDGCGYSPGSARTALNVNSATQSDQKSGFSNWGSCTHVWAPGSNILSAWYTGDNQAARLSGTSMAAPHVAGVAALYLADSPSQSSSALRSAVLSRTTSSNIAVSNTPTSYIYRSCP